ncbi:hypothetical protein DFJ73DRAFT_792194 [Zopfochytrium polystomum]|nr:hypothetical protein DFJ73DRAFT_792194 [Zopfochytrium polystomum]
MATATLTTTTAATATATAATSTGVGGVASDIAPASSSTATTTTTTTTASPLHAWGRPGCRRLHRVALCPVPLLIISQMGWKSHSMLQMYLTATVSGMAGYVLVEYLGLIKRSPKPPTSVGVDALGKYGANIVGGSMVGVGMALAGACPGTLILQASSGIPTAAPAMGGALFASITHGYIVKFLQSTILPGYGKKKAVAAFLRLLRLALGLAIVPFIGFLHSIKPYIPDLIQHLHITAPVRIDGFPPSPTTPLWTAIGAGLVIGATQLASLLAVQKPLGASSVYPYIGGNIARLLDPLGWRSNAPYYKDYVDDHDHGFLTAGMVLGGALSAALAGGAAVAAVPEVFVHPAAGLPSAGAAFVGGLLLVYGSRVAGGCTSGHGISGVAQLSLSSFVTVMAMFAAAMGLTPFIH